MPQRANWHRDDRVAVEYDLGVASHPDDSAIVRQRSRGRGRRLDNVSQTDFDEDVQKCKCRVQPYSPLLLRRADIAPKHDRVDIVREKARQQGIDLEITLGLL